MPEINVSKVCRFARMIKYRRGEAAVCLKDIPEEKILVFFNFPDKLSTAPNCIATHMYSSGHSMPDSYVNIEEMKGCDERQPPEQTIPAFPNMFPYNELLFQGKLSAKTRTWRWKHTGLTLLYTSSRIVREVAEAHGLNPKDFPRGALVGVGELMSVRETTEAEAEQIEREFANGEPNISIYAAEFRYEFRNLKRFKNPIPFKPPRGAVSVFNVPVSVVAKAFEEIGVMYCERD